MAGDGSSLGDSLNDSPRKCDQKLSGGSWVGTLCFTRWLTRRMVTHPLGRDGTGYTEGTRVRSGHFCMGRPQGGCARKLAGGGKDPRRECRWIPAGGGDPFFTKGG